MDSTHNLTTGTEIEGYLVERTLGRGGMATVYAVRHRRLGSLHALKLLDVPSRAIQARLEQEGRVQAQLRHPNVVSVQNIVTWQACPGLVMEYVDGLDLDALLQLRRLTLTQADAIVAGVLRGVRAAHRAGLVHRDLKPANVLLAKTPEGLVPKVNDFGLAKVLETDDGSARTRSGQVFGTPQYMAPEQFKDAKTADARSDVWSLGCILYEIIGGKRPFEGSDMFEIYSRAVQGNYAPIEDLVPDVPARMAAAIAGCLVVDRAARIPDCDTLLAVWQGQRTDWVPDLTPVSGTPNTAPATMDFDEDPTAEVAAVAVSAEELAAHRARRDHAGSTDTFADSRIGGPERGGGPTLVASQAGAASITVQQPASPAISSAPRGRSWLALATVLALVGVVGAGASGTALIGLNMALQSPPAATNPSVDEPEALKPVVPPADVPTTTDLTATHTPDVEEPEPDAPAAAQSSGTVASPAAAAASPAKPSSATAPAGKTPGANAQTPTPSSPAATPPSPASPPPPQPVGSGPAEPKPEPAVTAAPEPIAPTVPPPAPEPAVIAALAPPLVPPPEPVKAGPPPLRVSGVSDDRVSLRDAKRKYYWVGDPIPPGEYQIFLDDLHFAGTVTVRAGQPRLLVQCIPDSKECK